MDIEIEIVGKSNKWVLDQPFIRIGRSAKCEVTMPARQYPSLALEYIALEVVDQTVKLAGRNGVLNEAYLNDKPAALGTVVRSGDVLRLGAEGPELLVHFVERASIPAPAGYEPTRLIQVREDPGYEPTRVISIPVREPEPTERIPVPASRAIADRSAHSVSSAASAPYSPYASQVVAGGAASGIRQDRNQEAKQETWKAPAPAVPISVRANKNDSESSGNLEGRLKLMQYIVMANLLILVVLLVVVFQLNRQLSENREELRQLRAQAQTAVGQLTPALDAKLGLFEEHMDGLDAKLKAAEINMENGMDAKMKVTEDQMVNRMNTEIPAMLDKYVNRKLTELKR